MGKCASFKLLAIFSIAVIILSLLTIKLTSSPSIKPAPSIFPTVIPSPSPKQTRTKYQWYKITESPYHAIFIGSDIVVLDKQSSNLLTPDSTCETPIPQSLRTDPNTFYNDSVGILSQSPYKTIRYDKSSNTYIQTVSNAGCVSEEGRIKIRSNIDTGTVSCTITIGYKLLGC